MKINNLRQLFFFLLVILIACGKSKSYFEPGPTIDFNFNGVVNNKYNHSPIPGIKIKVIKLQYNSHGDAALKGTVTTDSKGEATLKLDRDASHSFGYLIRTNWTETFDSTTIASKFLKDELQLTEDQIASGKTVIELVPAGCIHFRIDEENWVSNRIDSVIITSPYETKSISHYSGQVYFQVDPFKTNQFSYYYMKNGVKSNTFIKEIYVHNSPFSSACIDNTITF